MALGPLLACWSFSLRAVKIGNISAHTARRFYLAVIGGGGLRDHLLAAIALAASRVAGLGGVFSERYWFLVGSQRSPVWGLL
jgi:hypothetical protein